MLCVLCSCRWWIVLRRAMLSVLADGVFHCIDCCPYLLNLESAICASSCI